MTVEAFTECVDGSSGHQLRPYQQELLDAALEENIIIYLDTGAGKTLVAALLAKHQIALQRNRDGNKRVFCLVPTTILVSQQAAVFRKYVAQSIGEYTGDLGVDAWSVKKWRQEIESRAMLVMTPAILDALIAEGTVPFTAISLLIFDEAHHCTKKHPYADIMRKYHELPAGTEKPKIFGMTASPVNTRAGSHEDMRKSIQKLQELLDARLKTVSDVAQRLLRMVVKYQNLQHKLLKLRNLPKGAEMHELDSRGAVTRAEGVKDWLMNKFGFCLLHQGPFCASMLLQEYFEHAAPDGTLATLGELGAEQEFYSGFKHPKGNHYHTKPNNCSPVVRERELQRVQEEVVQLERVCGSDYGITVEALGRPMVVLKQALLHAVVLCIRMLVPHPALSTLLATQAREHLMACERQLHSGPQVVDERQKASCIKTRGLSLLLEAALHAVPQPLLEQSIYRGEDSALPQKWEECMGCALMTDKVAQCLLKLQLHRQKAEREVPEARWAALVFAQRQSCCLTLHLLCQRITSWTSTLHTGALKSRHQGGVGSRVCNQTAVLERFREGAINVLFSTSVAEEGLDVQNCSIVVCYDVPKRPLSVVQTMGRARAQHSEVYFMQPIQPWDGVKPAVRYTLLLFANGSSEAVEPAVGEFVAL